MLFLANVSCPSTKRIFKICTKYYMIGIILSLQRFIFGCVKSGENVSLR
jgi:hypothetical protein